MAGFTPASSVTNVHSCIYLRRLSCYPPTGIPGVEISTRRGHQQTVSFCIVLVFPNVRAQVRTWCQSSKEVSDLAGSASPAVPASYPVSHLSVRAERVIGSVCASNLCCNAHRLGSIPCKFTVQKFPMSCHPTHRN